MEIRIVLFGATGRMGKEVIAAVERTSSPSCRYTVIGGVSIEGDAALGKIVSGVRSPLTSDWVPEYEESDVIIDFSSPAGTQKALRAASVAKRPLLVCTTGLSSSLDRDFARVAEVAPVIRTRNTSVGVNTMLKLVAQAAQMLGSGFDVELTEIHHRWKKDSPSGTAISLLESVAEAKGVSLDDVLTSGRSGMSEGRGDFEIGAQAVRGGDVAGDHTVYFLGQGERLEITHRVTARAILADGALRAAKWLAECRHPGMYSMLDVLCR